MEKDKQKLGGGFKLSLFSSLFGEDSHVDSYFSDAWFNHEPDFLFWPNKSVQRPEESLVTCEIFDLAHMLQCHLEQLKLVEKDSFLSQVLVLLVVLKILVVVVVVVVVLYRVYRLEKMGNWKMIQIILYNCITMYKAILWFTCHTNLLK